MIAVTGTECLNVRMRYLSLGRTGLITVSYG
uniref:Uncharacterized protein n=1 Tax=Anguilla anguilla TaxID=7936 RepID=A0A0E9QSG4_ANGAN